MNYTLRYHSSRAEIWRWYWSAWRAKLWRVHVLVAAVVALVVSDPFGKTHGLVNYALWFVASLPFVTLFFAAVPQVMFKSKERTLHVGPDGWSTQIGRVSGARKWSDIASVSESAGSVVITSKSGNALVVPSRAMPDTNSWQQFVKDAQAWHQEHAV